MQAVVVGRLKVFTLLPLEFFFPPDVLYSGTRLLYFPFFLSQVPLPPPFP